MQEDDADDVKLKPLNESTSVSNFAEEVEQKMDKSTSKEFRGILAHEIYVNSYPSCADEKSNQCDNICNGDRDPCYITANQNTTQVTWHVSKRSDTIDLEHLNLTLGELKVAYEGNEGEVLEVAFKGEVSHDDMKVDVGWNVNRNKQVAIKIGKALKYEAPLPKQKLYGLTVG